MLKRIPILLILMVYLVTSTGFAFNRHYCGKKVANVSLVKSKTCCKKSGKVKTAMKCCKDEQVAIKIDSKHVKTDKIAQAPLTLPVLLERAFPFIFSAFPADEPKDICLIRPPAQPAAPIFLKNQVFRI